MLPTTKLTSETRHIQVESKGLLKKKGPRKWKPSISRCIYPDVG